MTGRHRHTTPKHHRFGLLTIWHLFFSVNDRFITYQQRRAWRARAAFFLLLGVLLTLGVQISLGKYALLCPR
jgi:hypothetical protein